MNGHFGQVKDTLTKSRALREIRKNIVEGNHQSLCGCWLGIVSWWEFSVINLEKNCRKSSQGNISQECLEVRVVNIWENLWYLSTKILVFVKGVHLSPLTSQPIRLTD